MKRRWCWLTVALVVAVLGCAKEEEPVPAAVAPVASLSDARAVPANISMGQTTLLSVKVTDPQGVVKSVNAVVREYPSFSLDFNDAGQEGDEVAGDGIWSYTVEIPGMAPPGVYNFDFKACDADGNPITVTSESGEEEPLTAKVAIQVST